MLTWHFHWLQSQFQWTDSQSQLAHPDSRHTKYQVIHSILHRAKDQAWNQQSTLTCSRHYQQQVVHQVRHLCGVLKGNLCHDDCRWDSWPDRKHNCNHRSFKVNCVHTVWWWCDNLILDKKKVTDVVLMVFILLGGEFYGDIRKDGFGV